MDAVILPIESETVPPGLSAPGHRGHPPQVGAVVGEDEAEDLAVRGRRGGRTNDWGAPPTGCWYLAVRWCRRDFGGMGEASGGKPAWIREIGMRLGSAGLG